VAPLIAHHRQEINLFVTIMQSAKQTGLSRLTATVEPDSIKDTIIRRNRFRISHEEEIMEASMNHWKQSGNQATFIADPALDAIAREFREEDWNQVLKLIQPPRQTGEATSVIYPLQTSELWNLMQAAMETPRSFDGLLPPRVPSILLWPVFSEERLGARWHSHLRFLTFERHPIVDKSRFCFAIIGLVT
jgi:hypothetical protein